MHTMRGSSGGSVFVSWPHPFYDRRSRRNTKGLIGRGRRFRLITCVYVRCFGVAYLAERKSIVRSLWGMQNAPQQAQTRPKSSLLKALRDQCKVRSLSEKVTLPAGG